MVLQKFLKDIMSDNIQVALSKLSWNGRFKKVDINFEEILADRLLMDLLEFDKALK